MTPNQLKIDFEINDFAVIFKFGGLYLKQAVITNALKFI